MSQILRRNHCIDDDDCFYYSVSIEILRFWRQARLKEGGRSIDIDWLLNMSGMISFSKIILNENQDITLLMPLNDLTKIWQRHCFYRVPLQYLLGVCPWRDLYLKVNPGVLIPRQETELLLDLVLYYLSIHKDNILKVCQPKVFNWADLGTGSGAIAVALSNALPNWFGHATDYSEEALKQAKYNLHQLTSTSTTSIYYGFWLEPLKSLAGKLDLIVSNPPYIPSDLIKTLQEEVKNNEPIEALDGGIDGLNDIYILINTSLQMLAPGGLLFIEHHYDQSKDVINLMVEAGLKNIMRASDLDGIQRFVIASKALI